VHENIDNIRPKKGAIYMNVLTILGSPRAKGNTAHILNQYVLGIQHADSEAEINHIFLQNKNIKNCIGCNSCQRVGACVLQDDMNDIHPLIKNADVLVLATPVFVFNMTAQLKGFLDRLYAVDKELFKEKKIVLLTTYGDSNEASSGVQNIVNTIRLISEMLSIQFVQNINISTYDLQCYENEKALNQAFKSGKKLV